MKFCGCQNTVDCSNCLNYSVAYCPPTLINIPITNLTNGTSYYLWIIDKFNNAYRDTVTGNLNGSFDINQVNFPTGMFNNGFGKRDVFLTDLSGNNVQMNYGGNTYNCIMLKVSEPVYLVDDNCNLLTDDLRNLLLAQ